MDAPIAEMPKAGAAAIVAAVKRLVGPYTLGWKLPAYGVTPTTAGTREKGPADRSAGPFDIGFGPAIAGISRNRRR
jgi:hypothetical protein